MPNLRPEEIDQLEAAGVIQRDTAEVLRAQNRTFEPSGPATQQMPPTFEPSGPPQQQQMPRSFAPSGSMAQYAQTYQQPPPEPEPDELERKRRLLAMMQLKGGRSRRG